MANRIASGKVSPRLHDRCVVFAHTRCMARKQHQQWYLRQWRKARGYTQDRLAEMTGLSKPFISQLEGGKRQYTQELLELFSEALSCSPADLLVRDPSDPEGIWSLWEELAPTERRQVVEIGKTLKRTGTGG